MIAPKRCGLVDMFPVMRCGIVAVVLKEWLPLAVAV